MAKHVILGIKFVVKLLLKLFQYLLKYDVWVQLSWAQEGEDMILKRFFDNNKTSQGFYVDIGAHHPRRFSNTKKFYDLGWHGINIDAMPNSMKNFRQSRKRDINLEFGVGLKEEKREYYTFNHPAVNTFSKEMIKRNERFDFNLEKSHLVQIYPLASILDKHLPTNQLINFINIDVEGFDFEVLKSNDWNKYRPQLVLVEIENLNLNLLMKNNIVVFMKSIGYEVFAKTVNTVFFLNKDT